jgi:hypothetical protein
MKPHRSMSRSDDISPAPSQVTSDANRGPDKQTSTDSTTTVDTNSAPFSPKVSFDTFENPAASMFFFTLCVKSDGYRRTRSTRVFLCAAGADESGREALDWSLESLVQDGDELIVFRGIDQEELGESKTF